MARTRPTTYAMMGWGRQHHVEAQAMADTAPDGDVSSSGSDDDVVFVGNDILGIVVPSGERHAPALEPQHALAPAA